MSTSSSATLADTVGRFRLAMLEDVLQSSVPDLGVVVRAVDSVYHRNTYICVGRPFRETEANAALRALVEERSINPDRSLLIVADHDRQLLDAAVSVGNSQGIPVAPLNSFLDSHLRPHMVCRQLHTGLDARGASVLQGAGADDLLSEKVFIDPSAFSEHQQTEVRGVRKHLFDTWAKGVGPRVVVVIAPAGHGKSMLSHLLAKQLADSYDAFAAEEKPPLPFLISFGNFRRGTTSFSGLIMDRLQADGPPLVNADAFKELLSLGRVNFILDGFDEMIEANAETARQNIREFIDNAGSGSRILLTSRSTFFRTRADVESEFQSLALTEDDVEILELRPFGPEQIRSYINRRIAGDASQKRNRLHDLLNDADIAKAIENPMYLREVVSLLDTKGFSKADLKREGLLEYLVKSALEREQERQAHGLSPSDQRHFIEAVSLELLNRERPLIDAEELELLAQMYVPGLEQSSTLETDVSALLNHHYLAQGASGERTFTMHQLWREFFQASALAASVGAPQLEGLFAAREVPGGVLEQLAKRLTVDDLRRVRLGSGGRHLASNWIRLSLAAATDEDQLEELVGVVGGFAEKQLSNVTLRNLDLRRFSFARAQLQQVLVSECDLRGVEMKDATLRSVSFRNCRLDHSLHAAHIQSVEIDGLPILHVQQLATALPVPTAAEPPAAPSDVLSIREILRSRLELFVNPIGDSSRYLVKPSLKDTALTRGIDPRYSDLIRRGVIPALTTAGILQSSRSGRQSVYVVVPGCDREIIDFVVNGVVGPQVADALNRLERGR